MAVINGTAASETLPGTAAADTITGAGGNDKALMGAGNDVFVWNPGDGNDTVEGGTGNDTLRFNGDERRRRLLHPWRRRRARHACRTTILANETLDSGCDVERIEIQALGGGDSVHITALSGTDVKQVAIDLSNGTPGVGDGAVDNVTALAGDDNNTIVLAQKWRRHLGYRASGPAYHRRCRGRRLPLNQMAKTAMTRSVPRRFRTLVQLMLDGDEGNDSITGSAPSATTVTLMLAAAMATTRSPVAAATTSPRSAPATTCSCGMPATATTKSKAGMASIRCASSAAPRMK